MENQTQTETVQDLLRVLIAFDQSDAVMALPQENPLDRYVALIQILEGLSSGLPALKCVCAKYRAALHRAYEVPALQGEIAQSLKAWPRLMQACLIGSDAHFAARELAAHIQEVAPLLGLHPAEAGELGALVQEIPVQMPGGERVDQPCMLTQPQLVPQDDLWPAIHADDMHPDVTASADAVAVAAAEPDLQFDQGWEAVPAKSGEDSGLSAEGTGLEFDDLEPARIEAPVDAAAGNSADLYPEPLELTFDQLDPPATDTLESGAPTRLPAMAEPLPAQRDSSAAAARGEPLALLPKAVRELVELLKTELIEIQGVLRDTLVVVVAEHMERSIRSDALTRLAGAVERFGHAADAGGFGGLPQACFHLRTNLLALAESGHVVTDDAAALMESLLQSMLAYLATPTADATVEQLVRRIVDESWPVRFEGARAERLKADFEQISTMRVEDDTPQRPATAEPEDVSLEIPGDVNQDLLDGLLQEMPSHTEEFSAAVQRLVGGGTLEDVNIAQRAAHTLKGAGNTVGVRGIANLTHHLEDILLALARERTLPARPLAASLMIAADCLESMSEALLGVGIVPAEAQDVLQNILDWANRIDREGLPARDDVIEMPEPRTRTHLEITGLESTRTHISRAQASEPEGPRAQTTMIRVPAALVDELLRLVGETIILTGQVRERVERAESQTLAMQGQFSLLRELGSDLEQFIDLTDLSARQQRSSTAASAYDALEMDEYNELHTYSRRLVEAATDAAEMGKSLQSHLDELHNMLLNQERLNGETQEAVMRTRMVPVKTVFPRLQRSVRQTCRLTDKSAELHFRGGETLMDSDVLQAMVDPLMHLLRNAIDHGIEDPQTRSALGKSNSGSLRLEFGRDGNNILIRCADDGAGLDFAAIREAARTAGLIAESQNASDEELKRIILRPNFSTRSSATQISGRGIGLDAVNSRVGELGGTLNLESQTQLGCTVEMRLPVSLISSHALLARVGPYRVAIANRGVTQILHPAAGEMRAFGEQQVFHLEGEAYPVRALSALLGLDADARAHERHTRPLLMVQAASGTVAVLVDQVLESRDLVVKSFGRYISKLRGLIGATILGDGSVTPVLDLPELLGAPSSAAERTSTGHFAMNTTQSRLPLALVVDDSLSARRSLTQFLQDAGYEVRAARDGLEAVEILEGQKPEVLLVDLEMPRMNGIELTSYVRSTPNLADLPIVMITSRSAAKHREQAEAAGVNLYLTKPFAEDELLEHLQAVRSA
jgi:chemosensory pili system protein ChpA (sensor histidine kinase/response regulator)